MAAFKATTHFTESIRLFLFSDSAAYSFGSGCTVVLWACPDRPDCIQDIFAWAQQHPKDMRLHAGDGAASISVESRQELRACCDGVTETIKRQSGSKQVRQYHGEISFFVFHFSFFIFHFPSLCLMSSDVSYQQFSEFYIQPSNAAGRVDVFITTHCKTMQLSCPRPGGNFYFLLYLFVPLMSAGIA
jgi:hypothetical protein